MNKIEKFRKICKAVQYGGMIAIMGAGMFFVYWFGFRNGSQEDSMTTSMTYLMITILVLFAFMIFVIAPMQSKLLRLVILESLNGLVEDVKFDKKKGYNKESFMKLNYTNQILYRYLLLQTYKIFYQIHQQNILNIPFLSILHKYKHCLINVLLNNLYYF